MLSTRHRMLRRSSPISLRPSSCFSTKQYANRAPWMCVCIEPSLVFTNKGHAATPAQQREGQARSPILRLKKQWGSLAKLYPRRSRGREATTGKVSTTSKIYRQPQTDLSQVAERPRKYSLALSERGELAWEGFPDVRTQCLSRRTEDCGPDRSPLRH